MNMLKKIAGKLVTYLGFLVAINGLIIDCYTSIGVGVIIIFIGCTMHELNEGVEK